MIIVHENPQISSGSSFRESYIHQRAGRVRGQELGEGHIRQWKDRKSARVSVERSMLTVDRRFPGENPRQDNSDRRRGQAQVARHSWSRRVYDIIG